MSNESNKLISCHHHDYFEAACVKKAKIKLLLNDGSRKEGVAWDIVIRDRLEFLVVRVNKEPNNNSLSKQAEYIIEVELNAILSMEFFSVGKFTGKIVCLD